MRFLFLGRSVGKEKIKKQKKKNWKRSLELGGPVSQRNIRGAWKQQDVVIKSTWRQWKKEKSTSCLNSSENSAKRMNDQNCMAKRENLGRSDDAKQRKKRGWPCPNRDNETYKVEASQKSR